MIARRIPTVPAPSRAALVVTLAVTLAGGCSSKPAPATTGPGTSAAPTDAGPAASTAPAGTPTTVFEVPYYTVKSGDSIGKIARNLGVTTQQLIDANGIAKPDKIQVGQKLRVPVGGAAARAAAKAAGGAVTTTTAG